MNLTKSITNCNIIDNSCKKNHIMLKELMCV